MARAKRAHTRILSRAQRRGAEESWWERRYERNRERMERRVGQGCLWNLRDCEIGCIQVKSYPLSRWLAVAPVPTARTGARPDDSVGCHRVPIELEA